MPILPSILALLTIFGLILWALRPHSKPFMGWVAALPPGLVTAWLASQIPATAQGQIRYEALEWIPSLGIRFSFQLDGLALLFGLVVAGVGAGIALYTHDYLEHDPRQGYFYGLLFLFMTSMLGLVWADNLLTLFIFWEGTSISSYLLIGFNHTEAEARRGARNALIITGLGGVAMLAGLVLLGQAAGTYEISQLVAIPELNQLAVFPAALLLILLGAFSKSAQFPFHFWLPGAMAAPTPASAYLHSATMVKAGIYLLARLHPALHDSPIWFWGLVAAGGLTMLIGAFFALAQWDLKALLAYATVSQLGILTLLLAFESEAAVAAVMVGILAHALYKGPLFLVAGIVEHATGTRDIRRLAGLWKELPWTAAAALLAGLSMAGLPPLLGFLAKEGLLEALHDFQERQPLLGLVLLAGAVTAGALFVAYSFTLLWEAFLRREAAAVEQAHVHHRPRASFVLAPLALVLLGSVAPWFPQALDTLVRPGAEAVLQEPTPVHLVLWQGLTPVFALSLAAIGAGTILFLLRGWVRRLLALYPEDLKGANLFQAILDGLYQLAGWVEFALQDRTLATHAGITLLAGLAALLFAVGHVDLRLLLPDLTGSGTGASFSPLFYLPEMLLSLLAIVAAIVVTRAPTRLGAIISLGVVGITVTIFYVFFSAPDLALTQLLIEVLTVVLLVLVFAKVPPDHLPPTGLRRQLFALTVAGAAGIFGFGLVLFNASPEMQAAESISRFFTEFSLELAHGANVVNVILVDFRGFDTMGEITVLAIAALGGYALLRAPRYLLPKRVVGDESGPEGEAAPSAGSPASWEAPPVAPGPILPRERPKG